MADIKDELAKLKDQGKNEYEERFGDNQKQDDQQIDARDDQGITQHEDS